MIHLYDEFGEYLEAAECMKPEIDLSLIETIPISAGVPPWMHKEKDQNEPWFLISNCDIGWGC